MILWAVHIIQRRLKNILPIRIIVVATPKRYCCCLLYTSICASMGVSLVPIHATEYEDLFHCADQALYAAKQKGRNCYCIYDDSMNSLLSVLSEDMPYEEKTR